MEVIDELPPSEPPTIGERYSIATVSSNLRAQAFQRGDVDMFIAAGMVKDFMGATLFRLASEFDEQRGELRRAQDQLAKAWKDADRIRQAAEQQRRDSHLGPTREAMLRERADKAYEEAKHESKMARAFILLGLTTLTNARQELGRFALAQAARIGSPLTEREIFILSGQTLDALLDPTCGSCGGRGFQGGGRFEQSGPQIRCRECRGGAREFNIGRSEAQDRFVTHLLAEMSRSMSNFARALQRWMKGVG